MTIDRLTTALADRYRIERELGQGGMATVYLAHDVKHDRKVAIKVLKPELAAVIGAERFVVEIKTTAALQHPHILPLFDSGNADGFLYYVMPYIEGETLRAKLDRESQFGIDEAVKLTVAIADALDYAHRRGVIHRDIKPENILLHDGRPMVADFGIALALSAAAGGRMTETGMSLGTPHYMSPEQATADKEITGRSDIYSLGSVLYEMLAGEPPHIGHSAQQIIMKIIAEEVQPVTKHRKAVPLNIAAAVGKALEKLPADRFATAKAFADALTDQRFATVATRAGIASAHAPTRLSATLPWAAALLLALLAGWGWLRPRPVVTPTYQRVVLWLHGVGDFLSPGTTRVQSQVSIAPDGSSIVYEDSVGTTSQLMLKPRGQVDATPIAGTEGAMSPFFSPDGKWVAYFDTSGHLRKVPTSGGGSVPLADSANATYVSGAWFDDNTIIYIDQNNGLRRVSGDGGPFTVVRRALAGQRVDAVTLTALPGSHGFLFTGCPGNCASGSAIYAYDLRTDSTRLLVDNAAGASYAPTGHLLYTARDGGLYAAGFDLDRMQVSSGAIPVISGVAPARFALSTSGTAVYSVGTRNLSESRLLWVARDGSTQPFAPDWQAAFEYPSLAPDGRTLAVSIRSSASTRLWIRRADGSRRQVTVGEDGTWRASWTPDGRTFSFETARDLSKAAAVGAGNDLYEAPVDGSSPPRRTLHLDDGGIWEAEYSRDGEWQIIRRDGGGSYGVVLARRLRGDTTVRTILSDGTFNTQVTLSPDSRWLAFSSDISGTREVYVASFPDLRVRMLVSQGGGNEPRWAHSGRELFFKTGSKLVSVPVAPGAAFTPGIPRPLFSVSGYSSAVNRPQYTVAPDDRRFLMVREPDAGPIPATIYVEDFLVDLSRKMLQGKRQ